MTKQKPFAKKSLGQNFLVDGNYVCKIVEAVNPQIDETIIEIGAGRGALTEKLLEKAGKVLAIELDGDLIPILNETFGENKKFLAIQKDVLKIDFSELFEIHRLDGKKVKLAANLPYYISTAILQHLIKFRKNFSEMVLMLQKEVVERITAEAGNRQRGFLTVLIEAYFESEKLFDVPPKAFRPAPKVWSSVVILTPKNEKIENEMLLREVVAAGFSHKRKTISNNLRNKFTDAEDILNECGIDTKRRAETLTLEEWKNLSRKLM